MKKEYISPSLRISNLDSCNIICSSIKLGVGETEEMYSKQSDFNTFANDNYKGQ